MKKFFGWVLLIISCIFFIGLILSGVRGTLSGWILIFTPIIVVGAIFVNISWILCIPSSIFFIGIFVAMFMNKGGDSWWITFIMWLLCSIPLFIVGIILLNKNKGIDVKQKDINKKLKELESLLKDNLITGNEYKEKRKNIIDNI